MHLFDSAGVNPDNRCSCRQADDVVLKVLDPHVWPSGRQRNEGIERPPLESGRLIKLDESRDHSPSIVHALAAPDWLAGNPMRAASATPSTRRSPVAPRRGERALTHWQQRDEHPDAAGLIQG